MNTSKPVTNMLWRRLDTPGHDACWLSQTYRGWELNGCAVYNKDNCIAAINYHLQCDSDWRTTQANITGRVDSETIDVAIRRSEGKWEMNGEVISGLDECVDLDLGFTPATNLFQLRRLSLQIGESATYTVAWLDIPALTLQPLVQHYERRTASRYWYESPTFGYQALLEVDANGFITKYPDLWQVA